MSERTAADRRYLLVRGAAAHGAPVCSVPDSARTCGPSSAAARRSRQSLAPPGGARRCALSSLIPSSLPSAQLSPTLPQACRWLQALPSLPPGSLLPPRAYLSAQAFPTAGLGGGGSPSVREARVRRALPRRHFVPPALTSGRLRAAAGAAPASAGGGKWLIQGKGARGGIKKKKERKMARREKRKPSEEKK